MAVLTPVKPKRPIRRAAAAESRRATASGGRPPSQLRVLQTQKAPRKTPAQIRRTGRAAATKPSRPPSQLRALQTQRAPRRGAPPVRATGPSTRLAQRMPRTKASLDRLKRIQAARTSNLAVAAERVKAAGGPRLASGRTLKTVATALRAKTVRERAAAARQRAKLAPESLQVRRVPGAPASPTGAPKRRITTSAQRQQAALQEIYA